jgi:hypothetical protein
VHLSIFHLQGNLLLFQQVYSVHLFIFHLYLSIKNWLSLVFLHWQALVVGICYAASSSLQCALEFDSGFICCIRFTVCIYLSFISLPPHWELVLALVFLHWQALVVGICYSFIRFTVCIYLSFISTVREFPTVSSGLQCASVYLSSLREFSSGFQCASIYLSSTFHYYLILVEFASAGLQCASIFHYYLILV